MLLLLACAGLVNWLATTILVEAKLLEPVRCWVAGRTPAAEAGWQHDDYGDPIPLSWQDARPEYIRRPKLAYLVGCHLCTGTWVGLAMAGFVAGPFTAAVSFPPAAFVLNGLLFKALGHSILHVANLLERIAR